MARKREKAKNIVLKLRHFELLQGQGKSEQEAVRHVLHVDEEADCFHASHSFGVHKLMGFNPRPDRG
jgi:hypothetical protein